MIRVRRPAPHVKVASDGRESIHVAFTDGHPRETATSLYYARYTAGRWQRADGRAIPGPPLRARRRRPRLRRRASPRPRVGHDVAFDARGRPRIVYAVFRSATDHRYRHARWTGSTWDDRQLSRPAAPSEDGGKKRVLGRHRFDHADPDVVYLSRPVGGQLEIERRHGPAWSHTAVTAGSNEKNVRPVVARGGGVLWMRGRYVNYRAYRTAIIDQR